MILYLKFNYFIFPYFIFFILNAYRNREIVYLLQMFKSRQLLNLIINNRFK